jgi:uncharacterized protein with von Willebrand factor type A (vWA) domain
MRTGVRPSDDPAYDAPSSPSTALAVAPVQALAARLRASGLPVSTSEVLDAVRALARVDVDSRTRVRAALRATLVKDPTHEAVFGRAFDAVFPRPSAPPPVAPTPGSGAGDPDAGDPSTLLADALHRHDDTELERLLAEAVRRFAGTEEGRSVEHHTRRTLRRLDLAQVYRLLMADLRRAARSDLERAMAGPETDAALARLRRLAGEIVAARLGAHREPESPAGDVTDIPVLGASPDDLLALRQALRPLARRLATRLGARQRRGRGALDMRRTIRRSMGTGGVPVTPALRRRHPTRPDLVLLCDVSGSIAEYVPFALNLMQAVHREFSRVRSFVFVDGVVDVSDLLATSPGVLDPRQLLDRRGLVARDGRSDYTLAFEAFLRRYGDLVTTRTTCVVIGDARSHDRLPALAETRELAYRSRRLYWLNPEPRREWDADDSRLSSYAALCTDTFEVASLRQLAEAIARIS